MPPSRQHKGRPRRHSGVGEDGQRFHDLYVVSSKPEKALHIGRG